MGDPSMTLDEQDRIYGRTAREKREAERVLACWKRKAEAIEEALLGVANGFTANVLNEALPAAALERLPEKREIVDTIRQLQEADRRAAVLIARLTELENTA